jgi:hypothetical protein
VSGYFSISIAAHDPMQHGELSIRQLEAILLPARILPHASSKHRGAVNEQRLSPGPEQDVCTAWAQEEITAILLIDGDKPELWNEWYDTVVPVADQLYETYLQDLGLEGLTR